MDELRNSYDELENVIDTLNVLTDDIKYNKNILEQIEIIRIDAENEMQEIGFRLKKLEDAENREQELEYGRSRF